MRLTALDLRLERDAERPIAVALSGGSDSTALLLLAARWARANGRRLLALSVDHGLNPDSARWTAEAGEVAGRLGAEWRPLSWTGPKPQTGLPAAARRARHALLAEAARAAGAYVILMGHTADDIAESDLIRRDTPTHGRLETWAPSPVWPEGRGVFLLRPLLAVRRTDLRALLRAEGMAWLEDPANADPRFARSRARTALADNAGQADIEPPPAIPFPRRSVGVARADDLGRVMISSPVSADIVAKAVLCASGRERPPAGEAVRRLAERLAQGETFKTALGGARVRGSGGHAMVVRDVGERSRGGLSSLPLIQSEPVVFDGRFEVEAAVDDLDVAPLAGLAARLSPADAARLKPLPAEARGALPALVAVDGTVSLPSPFGSGPGRAVALAPRRLAAACGRIEVEVEAVRDALTWTG